MTTSRRLLPRPLATGNVITDAELNGDNGADTAGADGIAGIAWGSLVGSYGTLTVDANGNYAYQLNSADSAIIALTNGESKTETFTYTITDGDGDTDTATLTITINGADDGVSITGLNPAVNGGEATVDEADLGARMGEPPGSSPDAAALSVSAHVPHFSSRWHR